MLDIINYLTLLIIFATFLILIYMIHRIYNTDRQDKVNIVFSISLIFFSITILLFPIGGFHLSLAIITTKLYNWTAFLGLLLICWSCAIVYLGDENWDKPLLLLFFSFLTIIHASSLWLTNSFYIVTEKPLDLNFGLNFLMISGTFFLILTILSLIFLYSAYTEIDEKDTEIQYQIRMLLLGISIFCLAIIIGFAGDAIYEKSIFDNISQMMGFIGLFVMSKGFTRDLSLNQLKIISALNRSKKYISSTNIKDLTKVQRILKKAKLLAKQKNLNNTELSIIFLEIITVLTNSNIKLSQALISQAGDLIQSAKLHTRNNELEDLVKQLNLIKTTQDLNKIFKEKAEEPSIVQTSALDYLDKVIAQLQVI